MAVPPLANVWCVEFQSGADWYSPANSGQFEQVYAPYACPRTWMVVHRDDWAALLTAADSGTGGTTSPQFAQRVELERMLYSLRRGDTVVVYKLDRLARSLVGLLRVLERIDAVGACLRSLTEPIDTSTPVGRLMIQLLGSFAEFERSVIIERTKAGVDDARRRGVRFGRPRKIPVEALPRHVADGLNARQIAELYNVDTSSITLWLCRLGLNPRGFSRSKKLHRYAPWAQKNPL